MSKTISLVLGSGAARGFAHIGVIRELLSRGYHINAIAGSSMGAAVGGIYAGGKIEEFSAWAEKLTKLEVLRLVDFTFSSGGFIRGERIFQELRKVMGDLRIEEFSIPFVAVATDIVKKEEVWINSGNLSTAIRASMAIPSLLTPSYVGNRILVDGGVLNPLPAEPISGCNSEILIMVNLNGDAPYFEKEVVSGTPAEHAEESATQHDQSMKKWLSITRAMKKPNESFGYFGLLNKSIDLMQDNLCRFAIQKHQPDVVVSISRDACHSYEFYRAKEMIDEGRKACAAALDIFEKRD